MTGVLLFGSEGVFALGEGCNRTEFLWICKVYL